MFLEPVSILRLFRHTGKRLKLKINSNVLMAIFTFRILSAIRSPRALQTSSSRSQPHQLRILSVLYAPRVLQVPPLTLEAALALKTQYAFPATVSRSTKIWAIKPAACQSQFVDSDKSKLAPRVPWLIELASTAFLDPSAPRCRSQPAL